MDTKGDLELTSELRRAGVAASTIREALGPWVMQETDRIIAALAQAPSTLEGLLAVQSDAKALFKLKKQLEAAMGRVVADDE